VHTWTPYRAMTLWMKLLLSSLLRLNFDGESSVFEVRALCLWKCRCSFIAVPSPSLSTANESRLGRLSREAQECHTTVPRWYEEYRRCLG
jgi:hypothetical protein